MLHSIFQHIWKTQQRSQDWKRLVFIPISKEGTAKECSNYLTFTLILHSSKVMVKILQARNFNNTSTLNVQLFKVDLEKAEEPTSVGSLKKQESSRKNICFKALTMSVQFSSFQLLSHVRLFAIPWTAARQASLSITNSRSPPKHLCLYHNKLKNSSRDRKIRPPYLLPEKYLCRSISNS